MTRNVKTILLCIAVVVLSWYLLRRKPVLEVPSSHEFELSGLQSKEHVNVTIIATNDLHSTFDGLGLKSYPVKILGGYSRLSRLISDIR